MVDNNTVAVQLDYFYGMQSEMFSFLRIPKILIKDGRFEHLSNEAKMLFGLLLDRMSLSMKNRWFDDEDRVYIIYTTDEIMIDLNVGTQKCAKLLKELEAYGLIERKKQGFSKPDIIYVKNFATLVNDGDELPKEAEAKVKQWKDNKKRGQREEAEVVNNVNNSSVLRKSKDESFENQRTTALKIKGRELRKSKDENFENRSTTDLKIEGRELRKSKPNNTDSNDTDNSNINNSDTDNNIIIPLVLSHPILSGEDSEAKENEMRLDENHRGGVYFPLDLTESIPEEEEYNMSELLKEKNGIPYQYVIKPEMMKLAIQVLFQWNLKITRISDRGGVWNSSDSFYTLILRNIIYMATSLDPVKINSGKQIVTYSKLIESLNVIYHKWQLRLDGFDSLMERCIERYEKATNEQEIINPDAYAKSVIWSILQNYDADYNGWFNYTYTKNGRDKY